MAYLVTKQPGNAVFELGVMPPQQKAEFHYLGIKTEGFLGDKCCKIKSANTDSVWHSAWYRVAE